VIRIPIDMDSANALHRVIEARLWVTAPVKWLHGLQANPSPTLLESHAKSLRLSGIGHHQRMCCGAGWSQRARRPGRYISPIRQQRGRLPGTEYREFSGLRLTAAIVRAAADKEVIVYPENAPSTPAAV
jgi:hypothetical protein